MPDDLAAFGLAKARELRRCLDSTLGLLEALCERLPAGPEAFVLRSHIEGGHPEMHGLIDDVVHALNGPARDCDADVDKSFARGYQVALLSIAEEESGQRDPQAWREDPDAFMARRAEADWDRAEARQLVPENGGDSDDVA